MTRAFSVLVWGLAFTMVACGTEEVQPPSAVPTSPPADDATVTLPADVPTEDDVETTPEEVPTPLPGQEAGYTLGGLHAAYWTGAAASGEEATAVEADWALTRLESTTSVSVEDPALATLYQAGTFTGWLRGGLWIEEAGAYTLTALVGDSVEVRLDAGVVLSFWAMGTQTEAEAVVHLGQGWHALDIRWTRALHAPTLELWMGVEGEVPRPMDATVLGYPEAPLMAEPEATLAPHKVWDRGFELRIANSGPARVIFDVLSGEVGEAFETDVWTQHPAVSVTMTPETSAQVAVKVVDLWDREQELGILDITTPSEPPYTIGGLLGTYYQGTDFEEMLGVRWDSVLYFPHLHSDVSFPSSNISVRWEGGLWAEETGVYSLWFLTDDGQRLFLDGEVVAENWTTHSLASVQATVWLTRGWHALKAEVFQGPSVAAAMLEWAPPGESRTVVPSSALGLLLPEDDGADPEVTEFVVAQTGPDTFSVDWRTSELCTAAFFADWQDPEMGVVHQDQGYNAASTVFSVDLTSVPESLVILWVVLKDLQGNLLTTEFYEFDLDPAACPFGCNSDWQGDGVCDPSNNYDCCQYDGGDCCLPVDSFNYDYCDYDGFVELCCCREPGVADADLSQSCPYVPPSED